MAACNVDAVFAAVEAAVASVFALSAAFFASISG